jgi:hypothetical protein
MTMLMSEAWRALSAKQQVLYMYCKAQYYGEKRKPAGELSFTMNQSKWRDLYKIYTQANHMLFYRDMAALINKGFVTCVECGATTRQKTVYAFSSKWQLYGKAEFEVPTSDMTLYMLKELNKTKDQQREAL